MKQADIFSNVISFLINSPVYVTLSTTFPIHCNSGIQPVSADDKEKKVLVFLTVTPLQAHLS